jgi:hypothetical protein
MTKKIKSFGVLSMVMLPAKDDTFLTDNKRYMITIPRRGKYKDIDPDFFDEGDGEFDILNDKNILFLPSIIRVLYAAKQYPNLKESQLFVPISLKFKETEVDIIGQVVELVSNEEE